MLSCISCGRTLTDPRSVEKGIGPVCEKKTEVKFQSRELRKLAETKPLKPKLQLQMIRILKQHKVKILTSLKSKYRARHRQLIRKGHLHLGHYNTLHLDDLSSQLMKDGPYVALLYDYIQTDLLGDSYSDLMVILYRKGPEKKKISYQDHLARWDQEREPAY